MDKEQVLGIVRHTLTVIGGVLITKGYIDESLLAEGIGIIASIIGFVWSILSKNKV